jgi:hypothetical protein
MPKITVVLNINDCIASGFDSDPNELAKKSPWVSTFKQKGLYLEAPNPFIIHPGVIEFIQYLDKQHNIRLAFYGDKRNNLFVKELLCLALGQGRFDELRDQLIIQSESDLVRNKEADGINQIQKYGGAFFGNIKEDLTKISTSEEDLAWTVLIGTDCSFSFPGVQKSPVSNFCVLL